MSCTHPSRTGSHEKISPPFLLLYSPTVLQLHPHLPDPQPQLILLLLSFIQYPVLQQPLLRHHQRLRNRYCHPWRLPTKSLLTYSAECWTNRTWESDSGFDPWDFNIPSLTIMTATDRITRRHHHGIRCRPANPWELLVPIVATPSVLAGAVAGRRIDMKPMM